MPALYGIYLLFFLFVPCLASELQKRNAEIQTSRGIGLEEVVLFLIDEYRFYLQHQDGHIRVRWHRGERILAACIRYRHTSIMVLGVITYTSGSPLVHIDGTLNSACYISGVLRPVAVTALYSNPAKPTFEQDNARTHVAGIVRTFLDTENIRMFLWPARLPDLTPIKSLVYGRRVTGSSS
ncbi:transposable element Tcb1 transposase [Trichonephila clavipes]|nr:transposable element Tcb1 transposase [Trichonephila clavipes]